MFCYLLDLVMMVFNVIDGGCSKGKLVDVRRVFVLLMEVLIDINDKNIIFDMKEKVKKVVDNWKMKINNKFFEVLLFFYLFVVFELGFEFNFEEFLCYVVMIVKYK